MKKPRAFALCSIALVLPFCLFAQAPSLTIQVDHPTAKVSPILYGLMTEEINYSYDGGIYGELVRDRTIGRGFGSLKHWPMVARGNALVNISVDESTGPSEALPRSLRVTVSKADTDNPAGVENDGYWGIPVRPHTVRTTARSTPSPTLRASPSPSVCKMTKLARLPPRPQSPASPATGSNTPTH